MRPITLKYAGECRKCGAELPVGAAAIYERRVGVFCPACAPTEAEEIRTYRQEAADRKAERLEGWAAKRETRAEATIKHNRRYTGDIAFNTQPGHIPLRARIISQNDKAYESLTVAKGMAEKADRLRSGVRVAGDAEARRERQRDATRKWIKIGMRVNTISYGHGTVEKINRKTAKIGHTGQSGTYCVNVDLSWLSPAETIKKEV